MLKKAVTGLLCVCLLLGPGLALGQAAPLSAQELLDWRDALWTRARGMQAQNAPEETHGGEDGAPWLYAFDFGLVEAAQPLAEAAENPIEEIELLSADAACPRGLTVGMALAEVLDAYPNSNPALEGTAQYATLYISDGDVARDWGWVLRHNENVEGVEYAVSRPAEGMDGFWQTLTLLYVVENGLVTSIRAGGFLSLVSDEEAAATAAAVREFSMEDSFRPGTDRGEVARTMDTFTFEGIAFAQAAPEAYIALLGQPLDDSVSEGIVRVRTLTYPDVLIEALAQGDAWRVEAVLVTAGAHAGPGGIRIGDSLASVTARFGGEADEDGMQLLWEDGEGGTYALTCSFYDDILTEYLLYRI